MSLAQDIYIQFLDHFSSLTTDELKTLAQSANEQAVSHHNHTMVLALQDVLKARGV
ncbi:hypothetical protein [Flammeovirga agarivorans]|uniref:Uncharacterized protein n=1 Tax=Flammeovirga agarivorans TaxID=2726742 RepID=A0A7X8XXZ6_9BACT|nr:hypothetical protein [Flammeovirga agarivorans]NLR93739.1 hypothetical protein [Flammeovirga agarivorans]